MRFQIRKFLGRVTGIHRDMALMFSLGEILWQCGCMCVVASRQVSVVVERRCSRLLGYFFYENDTPYRGVL
jgi:hypothetical protein